MTYRGQQTTTRAPRPSALRRAALPFALLAVAARLAAPLRAESARELIAKGNRAYAAESYEEALDAYEQASVEMPESPYVYFNRGGVHYRKADYEKAREAFEKAALKTKDHRIEAKCRYNLGNCSFRECERQQDSDLKKALGACEKSITLYQEALKLDPELQNAARNIEVARLTMKNLLDEIKKREEEEAKQQEQQKKVAEKLKELIKRQERAANRNQALQKQKAAKGDSPRLRNDVQGLAGDQDGIRQDTQKLSNDVTQMAQQGCGQQACQPPQQPGQQGCQPPPPPGQQAPQPQPPSPSDQVKQHLDQAVSAQDAATGKLESNQLKPAHPDQKRAAEELKKALESMTQPQDKQQQQKQQGDQQQGQKEEQKEQEKQEQQGQEDEQKDQEKQEEQEKQEKQQALANEKARDILDEEKENREKRQAQPAGGYRAVDKDW